MCKKKNHLGDFPVLQPLPAIHFANEKTSSSHPDLQTCLNNTFQLLADTLMSKFEDLTKK